MYKVDIHIHAFYNYANANTHFSVFSIARLDKCIYVYKSCTCNQMYSKKDRRRKCFFCGNVEESQRHVFLKCEHTSPLVEIMKNLLENKSYELNTDSMILGSNLSKQDYKAISTYKYCIWRLRNIVRSQRAENIKVLFNYLFFKFLNK